MSSPDIEALAEAAASGDTNAMNDLLVAIEPTVAKHCRKFLPNRLDAEEATQDALVAISRNLDRFEGRSKFTTWIYPICTNASIDCYRKLKRRQSVLETPPEIPSDGSTPSVMTGAKVALLEAAEQLDPDVVELVLMRDLLDLDYADMATLRDTKEPTIRWQVSEARKKMQRLLSPAD